LAASITTALEARSIACHRVEAARGFGGAADALRSVATTAAGPIDALVVALAGPPLVASSADRWEQVLADHRAIVEDLHVDAGWARAAADYATATSRPVQLVTLTDAITPAGRSRAQASAQLARAAADGTRGKVTAFAVSLEAAGELADQPIGALVVHLLDRRDATTLAGAELVMGTGWIGLRSHPRPIGSVTYGGPGIPTWLDATLREIVGGTGSPQEVEAR
jgi:hypothetical protein